MRFRWTHFALLAIVHCLASPAAAMDLSAEVGLVSDYRYRGVSLSKGDPAAQASLTLEHESGFYANGWTSTIREDEFAADVEVDFTLGLNREITGNVTADLSVTYYAYPGEASSNYVEVTLLTEAGKGPATASLGASLVPAQRGTRDEQGRGHGNNYLFAGVAYELETLPLTMSARLGRERGFFDEAERGGKWDWALGCEASLGQLRVAAEYVGSDLQSDRHAITAALFLDL